MDESLLDAEIIEHVKEMFGSLLHPTQEILDSIYSEINSLFSSNENFCFDILAIAIDEELPELTRTLAIFVLKANHKLIPKSVIPQFAEYSFTFLESVIQNGETLFINEANSLFCLLFNFYGEIHYKELYPVIAHLLENEGTVTVGLQCMLELVGKGDFPPNELVSPLTTFISGDFAGTQNAVLVLTIIRILISSNPDEYIEQVTEEFIGVIDENSDNYESKALNEVFYIFGILFYHTKDEDLGNLIAQLIENQDLSEICDMLNYFCEIEHFPFNENICCALYNHLEEPDPETDAFGICSTCMCCLNTMSSEYASQVWETIFPLLTQCTNDGQILRTLSNITTNKENINEFVPFIMSHMGDEHRGDAAISLMNICRVVPDLKASVFDELLPLINDEDLDVRDQIFFALEELLPCEKEKPEWFESLIAVYKETEEVIKVSRLISQYLDGIQELDPEQINDLLQAVLERYFQEETDVNEERYNIILLTQLIGRAEEQPQELLVSIIGHAIELLTKEDTIYEILLDSWYESICTLIDNIYMRYRDALVALPVFKDFMGAFTEAMSMSKISFTEDGSMSLISHMYEGQPAVIEELGQAWALAAASSLPFKSITSIKTIINFWAQHIEEFDQNTTMAFALGLCQVYSNAVSEIITCSNAFEFLGKIIERLQQFEILPENVQQFYEAISARIAQQEQGGEEEEQEGEEAQ